MSIFLIGWSSVGLSRAFRTEVTVLRDIEARDDRVFPTANYSELTASMASRMVAGSPSTFPVTL